VRNVGNAIFGFALLCSLFPWRVTLCSATEKNITVTVRTSDGSAAAGAEASICEVDRAGKFRRNAAPPQKVSESGWVLFDVVLEDGTSYKARAKYLGKTHTSKAFLGGQAPSDIAIKIKPAGPSQQAPEEPATARAPAPPPEPPAEQDRVPGSQAPSAIEAPPTQQVKDAGESKGREQDEVRGVVAAMNQIFLIMLALVAVLALLGALVLLEARHVGRFFMSSAEDAAAERKDTGRLITNAISAINESIKKMGDVAVNEGSDVPAEVDRLGKAITRLADAIGQTRTASEFQKNAEQLTGRPGAQLWPSCIAQAASGLSVDHGDEAAAEAHGRLSQSGAAEASGRPSTQFPSSSTAQVAPGFRIEEAEQAAREAYDRLRQSGVAGANVTHLKLANESLLAQGFARAKTVFTEVWSPSATFVAFVHPSFPQFAVLFPSPDRKPEEETGRVFPELAKALSFATKDIRPRWITKRADGMWQLRD
jgi:hypothetical protein